MNEANIYLVIIILIIIGTIGEYLAWWLIQLIRKLDKIPENKYWDEFHGENEYYSMEIGGIVDYE